MKGECQEKSASCFSEKATSINEDFQITLLNISWKAYLDKQAQKEYLCHVANRWFFTIV